MRTLVEEVFRHTGKSEVTEDDFVKYYRDKGMSAGEADDLWAKAQSLGIIRIGVKPIWAPGNPLEILGHRTVFELIEKEEE